MCSLESPITAWYSVGSKLGMAPSYGSLITVYRVFCEYGSHDNVNCSTFVAVKLFERSSVWGCNI